MQGRHYNTRAARPPSSYCGPSARHPCASGKVVTMIENLAAHRHKREAAERKEFRDKYAVLVGPFVTAFAYHAGWEHESKLDIAAIVAEMSDEEFAAFDPSAVHIFDEWDYRWRAAGLRAAADLQDRQRRPRGRRRHSEQLDNAARNRRLSPAHCWARLQDHAGNVALRNASGRMSHKKFANISSHVLAAIVRCVWRNALPRACNPR